MRVAYNFHCDYLQLLLLFLLPSIFTTLTSSRLSKKENGGQDGECRVNTTQEKRNTKMKQSTAAPIWAAKTVKWEQLGNEDRDSAEPLRANQAFRRRMRG